MDVGGILSVWPQGSRAHPTEEQQAKVAHTAHGVTEHTRLTEAGKIECVENKRKAED